MKDDSLMSNEASTSRQHPLINNNNHELGNTDNDRTNRTSSPEDQHHHQQQPSEFAEKNEEAAAAEANQACPNCGYHQHDSSQDHHHHQLLNMNLNSSGSGEDSEQMNAAIERFAAEIQQVARKTKRKDGLDAVQKLRQIVELFATMLKEWTSPAPPALPPQQLKSMEKAITALTSANHHVDELGEPVQMVISKQGSPKNNNGSAPKSDKKRKRTKFSEDQKQQLFGLAERVDWALGSLTKEDQEKSARDIGITVDTLKYWFHNTKQKQKQKQES